MPVYTCKNPRCPRYNQEIGYGAPLTNCPTCGSILQSTITVASGAIAGAVIGFAIAGPAGAALGIILGSAIGTGINENERGKW
jgi:outer membrane lipoprotein SlyB